MFKKLISLYKEGKKDNDVLAAMLIPLKSYVLCTILSFLFVAIVAIPIIILNVQFVSIYGYLFLANKFFLYLGLTLIGILFIVVNALINLGTLKLLKHNLPELDALTNVNNKSFFIYHLFNPGFIIFTFAVLFIFGGFI